MTQTIEVISKPIIWVKFKKKILYIKFDFLGARHIKQYLYIFDKSKLMVNCQLTLPKREKNCFTSSTLVSWLTPPTNIFFVLLFRFLFLGVACLGSIFLPSKTWWGFCRTFCTEEASSNVMKPKPRLLWSKNKSHFILVLLYELKCSLTN